VNDAAVLSVAGEVVESGWRAIPRFSPDVGLDLFVVMPNHVHGILVLGEGFRAMHPPEADTSPLRPSRPKGAQAGSMSAILQSFKATTSRRVRSLPELQGVRLWQRGFYDHIIRDEAELNRLRRYIEENPLRLALDEENPHRRV
jgi:REP element-mobilizing transposase RayT